MSQKTLFDGISNKPHDRKREKLNASQRKYVANNLEKVRERARIAARKRRITNLERVRETERKSARKHREKRSASYKAWYRKNRDKILEELRIYHAENPHSKNLKRLRMSKAEAFAILEQQDWRCAICRIDIRDKDKRHLDHDHARNAFRGFLCNSCNTLLGMARDNPETLRQAAIYLERFNASRETAEIHPFFGLPKAG